MFESAVNQVGDYLRSKFDGNLISLSEEELKGFASHCFVSGWRILDEVTGVNFKVLLPKAFPFVVPRIAIEDNDDRERDFAKELPHVEEHGLLCLPAKEPSLSDPDRLVNALLYDAVEFRKGFIESSEKRAREFREEFISYWIRQKSPRTIPLFSLVDVNADTHELSVVQTKDGYHHGYHLIADSNSELIAWHKNRYSTDKIPRIYRGLFVKLTSPLIPPYPETVSDLRMAIEDNSSSEVVGMFDQHILSIDPFLVAFAAESKNGVGLMGVRIARKKGSPDPVRGFRSPKTMSQKLRLARCNASSSVSRRQVARVDHLWVHGRDKDVNQEKLKNSSVMILGCGSLGSHVAIRLAQSGVGNLTLIDPDELEPANVGRHALGMRYAHTKKVEGLAKEIKVRFPHIQVLTYPCGWHCILENEPNVFEGVSLIVSAMAEWGEEGRLNSWHVDRGRQIPIVYGWMEPHAIAAHAFLVSGPDSCLGCVLDDMGRMRESETTWDSASHLASEPACGAIYQPYGPTELAFAEAIVADLAISALLGGVSGNIHRVHCASEERIESFGGSWTAIHKGVRPAGFRGSFQRDEAVTRNFRCKFC